MSVSILGMKTNSPGYEFERSRLLPTSGQVQNVSNTRVYVFGDIDVSDEEVDDSSIEMTTLRPRNKAKKVKNNHANEKKTNEITLLERQIRPSDSLHGFALQYAVPVSELKRINNLIIDQDFHALSIIKIPVKNHGLLTEIEQEERRRRVLEYNPAATTSHLEEYRTNNSDEEDDEEEIYSVRKISIRDAICDGEAKQFLRNMDEDLKRIQTATSSKKESLDEVLSMLTEKRIHPFQFKPQQNVSDGATCGLKWWLMVALIFIIGILTPAVFYYLYSETSGHRSNSTQSSLSKQSTLSLQ